MTFVRVVGLRADDGITIPVPILLEDEESVVEFIDLPYSGVSPTFFVHSASTGNSLTSLCCVASLNILRSPHNKNSALVRFLAFKS